MSWGWFLCTASFQKRIYTFILQIQLFLLISGNFSSNMFAFFPFVFVDFWTVGTSMISMLDDFAFLIYLLPVYVP